MSLMAVRRVSFTAAIRSIRWVPSSRSSAAPTDLMSQPMQVILYTDGACLGNPGPGGYGVVVRCGPRRSELSGGFRRTTNNRMELMAAIVGLESLHSPCTVTLYTDSQYVA